MNSVGIDFYRLVADEMMGSWSQVYVRVPFEDGEWKSKGALFGVLSLKGESQLPEKGAEILDFLDEYYNQLEGVGDLKKLVELLKDRDKDLVSAWVWVEEDGKERRVKMWADSGGGIRIKRQGSWVDLVKIAGEEKVISGKLEIGDKLWVAVGKAAEVEVDEFDETTVEKIGQGDSAWVGLLMEVKERDEDEEIEEEDEMVETVEAPMVVKETIEETKNERTILVGEGHKKKKLLLVGVLFLVFLVVSVVVGTIRLQSSKAAEAWKGVSEPIDKKRVEAEGMVETNRLGARKLLTEAKDEWKKYDGEYSKGNFADEYKSLGQKLDQAWIKVSGEKEAGHELFWSLELVRADLKGSRLALAGSKKVVILDESMGLVMSMSMADKAAEVLGAKGEGKGWVDVTGDDKMAVVIGKSGLVAKTAKTEVEKAYDSAVVDPVAVEMFSSAAYVLDPGAGEIWRYVWVDGAWGERKRWLKEGQELKVDKAVDIAIDSDVWVLGTNGQLGKFRRGAKETFSLRGAPEGLVGDRLAVETEGKRVAILDKKNKRVVLFDKETGDYIEQWSSDIFAKAMDMVFTADGKLMVLSDGKLEMF